MTEAAKRLGERLFPFLRKAFVMFRYVSFLVMGVLLFCLGGTANCDLVITGITRGVTAASTGAAGDGDVTFAPGIYTKDATSVGSSAAGHIGSFAHQSSTVPGFVGPTMGGVGTADTFASATGFTGFSNFAESYYVVDFKVSSSGFYKFTASSDWVGAGPPPYGGFAKVELLDITGASTIESVTSTPASPGIDSVSGFYFLTAGDDYRVVAEVEIAGGFATAGFFESHGEWSFMVVPEPGILGLGIAGMAFGALIRRRK